MSTTIGKESCAHHLCRCVWNERRRRLGPRPAAAAASETFADAVIHLTGIYVTHTILLKKDGGQIECANRSDVREYSYILSLLAVSVTSTISLPFCFLKSFAMPIPSNTTSIPDLARSVRTRALCSLMLTVSALHVRRDQISDLI
jgi:hypothetical protein